MKLSKSPEVKNLGDARPEDSEEKRKRKKPAAVREGEFSEGDFKARAAEALHVARVEDAVLYRDADYIAINKPWGLSVTDGPKVKDSLQRHLRAFATSSSSEIPTLIHRLDTQTAGVQLLARHRASATMARDRIGARSFWSRIYWALVWGRVELGPRQFSGTINIPLVHRGHHVVPASFHSAELSAITKWEILKYSSFAGGVTLLKLEPYTGRRDQLQAHCAFGLRTPIVGDEIYAKQAIRWSDPYPEKHMRQRIDMFGEDILQKRMVCSRQISMHSFGGEQIDIVAPVPPHMQEIFDKLGWYIEDEVSSHCEDLWDAVELPHEVVPSTERSPTYEPYHNDDPLLIPNTVEKADTQPVEKPNTNFVRRYHKRLADQKTIKSRERLEDNYHEWS
ncbi:nad kinase [Perkinsus chesapeaki]|uniref:Nad kinase n=1 Tax=Perkinsus chesapeaki TaxID=330153 RepID=A0A7J6MGF6_PERCH|nr:nad kinase [Perkinsus chesapeaki]